MAEVSISTDPRTRRTLVVVVGVSVAFLALVWAVNPLAWMRDQVFGPGDPPAAGDATLLEIRETADLRVATGAFSVPVYFGDGEQSLLGEFVPDFIDGDSGVAIYQGSVDAMIDLQKLTQNDIDADQDARTLRITVPAPRLTEPNIDEENSTVVAHSRGVGTRVSEFFDDNPLQARDELDATGVAAVEQAARDSELEETARRNGRAFLTTLGHRLGYDEVTVEFSRSPS